MDELRASSAPAAVPRASVLAGPASRLISREDFAQDPELADFVQSAEFKKGLPQ